MACTPALFRLFPCLLQRETISRLRKALSPIGEVCSFRGMVMQSGLRIGRRRHQDLGRRGRYWPSVEALEDRCLLTGLVIDPIAVPLTIPVGKTLIVPVTGSDSEGGAISYSISSPDPSLNPYIHSGPGDPFLKLTIQGYGDLLFDLYQNQAPQAVAAIAG